ncbi:DUF3987 domain-containing protein [Burkholderia pseudomallei]|uniref:DUF3987 domain-containing protein n=1 Tax=Burkholderia pseudomallei TaxID=28450 RepID=UPI001AD618BF|nr:DUF3987 domain-containing protein [Burkholderia pseudomallei]MBO7930558.1 DUF3987 domain-containing protein [Burkholderia pseudomallei]
MFYSEPMSDRAPTYSIVRPKGRARMSSLAPSRSPYPIGGFPGLSGSLVRDLTASGAVAPEIVGSVAIAAMSLLTQGLADISWPNGQASSIGANAIVVSPSGSGKTVVYNWFMGPIEKYLEHLSAADPEGWHCGLLQEDPTRPAIVQSLDDCPVAGLFTDEGGVTQKLLKDSATLVKLLDGTPLRSARVSTGRIALKEQRFCMLLMEQPDRFDETKPLLGGRKGGVGMVNRFFLVHSTGRCSASALHDVRLSEEVAQAYEERVLECLGVLLEHLERGNRRRPTLSLTAEAYQCFIEIDREARQKCTPASRWFPFSEYIVRHAERVLRLAGVLHVFEHGVGGEISLDTLERAESLANWYVESFAQIFFEPPKPTLAETDADSIAQGILGPCLMGGVYGCSVADLRTAAFNLGLTSTRFTRALAVLCGQGRVRMIRHLNKPWILFDLAYSPLNW